MSSEQTAVIGQPQELVCEDGETIFREGQTSDRVYQVLSGRVELTKQSPGGSLPLAILGVDEIFGEMGVLDGSVRSASARALGRVRLRCWERDDFLRLLEERPENLLALLRKVSERLRKTNEDMSGGDMAASVPGGGAKARRRASGRQFQEIRTDFQPDAVEIEERAMPLAARVTLVTLVLFLASGITWASLAQLDRIISADGKLITTAPKILIQPLDTMVMRKVEVRPGQEVMPGQVLARLDPTFAEADATATQASITSLSAQLARLRAEIGQGDAAARFSDDPHEEQLQRQIFDTHARERGAELRTLDEEIHELTVHLESVRQDRKAVEDEKAILRELTGMRRELFRQQSGSKITLLEAQRQLIVAERESERLSKTSTETEHRLNGAKAKRDGLVNQWRTKDMTELVTAERDLAKLAEEAKKRERLRTLVELTAPAHAVVLEVAPRAAGSVLRQADTLMTLVPLDGEIEAEVSVRPQDITHLRKDDSARVKLEALPFQKYGTVDGRVSTISEDVLDEELSGRKVSFYRIRLALDASRLKEVPADFRLIPGMAVTAEIKVGTRSLISYFLYPIIRTLDTGLREP
jgi:HlyD family secretion protein